MVVFTCGHCGESVQKPKVEKHYLTKCRNRNPNLSCMDCFKDFLGTDYESHTKCITEEERYSGKGFMAKEKKGEKKQNTWVEMLQSVLDEQKNIAGNVRRIIETVSKQNNTPRKKPKFINFVKNVCGHKTNPNDIDQAWDLISVKLSELSNANKNQNQKKQNGDANGDTKDEEPNGVAEADTTTEDVIAENGAHHEENEDIKPTEGPSPSKKLSKKQKKEEKKRQKYEAELQSAVAPPVEEEDEGQSKKDKKKKKNRTESQNGNADENVGESKGKKKRKRQDTTNSVTEVVENGNDNVENVPVVKEKTQKKKLKVGEVEPLDESVCLHDQNVALTEEEVPLKNGNFDWHAVIISVLEKKGNEVPFKRLQKKVLSEFSEMTGQDVDDRIADKFIKKLKSAPNVRVDKNRVLLVQ